MVQEQNVLFYPFLCHWQLTEYLGNKQPMSVCWTLDSSHIISKGFTISHTHTHTQATMASKGDRLIGRLWLTCLLQKSVERNVKREIFDISVSLRLQSSFPNLSSGFLTLHISTSFSLSSFFVDHAPLYRTGLPREMCLLCAPCISTSCHFASYPICQWYSSDQFYYLKKLTAV